MYYIWSTVVMYIVITASMRLLGKRQIGELQATELVVTFLIADLAVIPLQNEDTSLWSGLIPISVLVLCEMIASWFIVKSGLFRQIVCGKPVVIIKEGKLIQGSLRKLRISVDELFEELRLKDIFSLNDILYGIVETNGKLSIMLKSEADTVKRRDMKIKTKDELMVCVVADGVISKSSLKLIGISESDIIQALKKKKLQPDDVFIMLMDSNKNTRVIQKELYKPTNNE